LVEQRPDEPFLPTLDHGLQGVEDVVRSVLAAHGVGLLDVSLRMERPGWVLRVVLDVAASGQAAAAVSVEQCAQVSRDLSAALDVADLVSQAYTLEVSSPGIERPLRNEQDYERFSGHTAKLMLFEPLPNGERVIRGTLRGVREHQVIVEREPGQTALYPIAAIKRAHLLYQMPSQLKKSRFKKKRAAKGR
jgi:ribosome maturation factor RimP